MSASVVNITPDGPVALFGRAARTGHYETIATALEANVIALPAEHGTLILIGLDTLFSSTRLKQKVVARLTQSERSALAELVLVATHTHNAPALDASKPRLGALDDGYLAMVADPLATAMSALLAGTPAPVVLTRGASVCTFNARRRRHGLRLRKRWPYVSRGINLVPVHDEGVPRAVDVIVARGEGGRARWALWSWTCHATSAPELRSVSADFPGAVRDELRARLGEPGLPVVYLPGFCGDIRPDPSVLPLNFTSLITTPLQRPFARATADNYAALCAALTTAIGSALAAASPLGPLAPARIGRAQLALDAMIAPAEQAPAEGAMDVTSIDMGVLGLLLLGAEVCSPYLAKLTALVPAGWLMSGYAGQVFGYLPSDEQIAEGGYEADEFYELFGLRGRFRAEIEDQVSEAVKRSVAAARQDG